MLKFWYRGGKYGDMAVLNDIEYGMSEAWWSQKSLHLCLTRDNDVECWKLRVTLFSPKTTNLRILKLPEDILCCQTLDFIPNFILILGMPPHIQGSQQMWHAPNVHPGIQLSGTFDALLVACVAAYYISCPTLSQPREQDIMFLFSRSRCLQNSQVPVLIKHRCRDVNATLYCKILG